MWEQPPSAVPQRRSRARCSSCGLRLQRIHPPQPRKSSKIAIRRVEHAAIFNRKSRDLCVTHQRSCGSSLDDHLPQYRPMAFAWQQDSYDGVYQPFLHCMRCLLQCHPLTWESPVGHNSQKRTDCLPGQANRLHARQNLLGPGNAFQMMFRIRIVGVDQHIGIDDNHR